MNQRMNRGPHSALESMIRGRVASDDVPRWTLARMAIYADDIASPGVSSTALLRNALKYRKALATPGARYRVRVR